MPLQIPVLHGTAKRALAWASAPEVAPVFPDQTSVWRSTWCPSLATLKLTSARRPALLSFRGEGEVRASRRPCLWLTSLLGDKTARWPPLQPIQLSALLRLSLSLHPLCHLQWGRRQPHQHLRALRSTPSLVLLQKPQVRQAHASEACYTRLLRLCNHLCLQRRTDSRLRLDLAAATRAFLRERHRSRLRVRAMRQHHLRAAP